MMEKKEMTEERIAELEQKEKELEAKKIEEAELLKSLKAEQLKSSSEPIKKADLGIEPELVPQAKQPEETMENVCSECGAKNEKDSKKCINCEEVFE